MKWLAIFAAGAALGLLFQRQTSPPSPDVEINCPKPPECPALKCEADAETLGSLKIHQDLLVKCYGELEGERERLEQALETTLSLKEDLSFYRDRASQPCN